MNPADVKVIVMTHLHYDHASGMAQFPNSTFLTTKWEWDAANGPFSLLHGYVRRHFVRDVDYRLLDFEGRGAESYATFGRTLDLFGDGSVRVLPTPGHTHGHISVILRTSSLEILVAGDATYTRHTLETGHRPARVEDERMYTRSLRGLQIYHRERPDSLVIPGHDLDGMRCVGFMATLQRGSEWAATGKVTIALPKNFPTEKETSAIDGGGKR